MDELQTVIAIPPLAFRGGAVDKKAHRKNMRYLVERNFLSDQRRRAIGIAGTSLVHHVGEDTLVEVLRVTGEAIGREAVIIAGLVATPPAEARGFVKRCTKLKRPPDYFLLMPIPGVCNPEGIAAEFSALTGDAGRRYGARFLLYVRSSDLIKAYAQVMSDSPHIVGVKVGTREADVASLRSLVPATKEVLWGVGDRATEAARLGAQGHTSGITLICPRVCDEIFNAYRRKDFVAAEEMEKLVVEFEDIRFMEGRAYNYSAVVAAARLCDFQDVDLGDGGPFNAPPPPPVMSRIAACVERLREFH